MNNMPLSFPIESRDADLLLTQALHLSVTLKNHPHIVVVSCYCLYHILAFQNPSTRSIHYSSNHTHQRPLTAGKTLSMALSRLECQHRSPSTSPDLSKMSQSQPLTRLKRLDLPHRHCLLPFLLGGAYRKAQPHQFRFLDLPPELRNMVYDYTFAEGSRGLVPHPLTQVN